jgi:hypothetical protein
MSLLLDTVLHMIQLEFSKKEPIWTNIVPEKNDIAFITRECNMDSDFDPLNTRKMMLQRMNNREISHQTRHCEYGQIFIAYDSPNQVQDVPWGLWARILRLYHQRSMSPSSVPFKIYMLLSPHIREFPRNGPIGPTNINGGYTYPCNHETVVVYRAEDATRVLIHELQHSACLDHEELGIDRVEAETEAWAELFYCAFLSHGDTGLFHWMISSQSAWILAQNARVRTYINKTQAFPWRYTIGKELVWRRWGILVESDVDGYRINSLRLTAPPKADIKRFFGVSSTSIIL